MTNVTRQELEACARLLNLRIVQDAVNGGLLVVHPNEAIPRQFDPTYDATDREALARAAKLNICYEADFVALPASCPKVGNRLYGWPSDGTESECILHAAAAVQAEREKQQ